MSTDEPEAKFFEGRLAQLTARLFWMLPGGVHDWLERVSGGWRVVVWTKPTTSAKRTVLTIDSTDFEIDAYCWEYWPEGHLIRRGRS